MPTDFHDAHERHWDDAERLHQALRWANADHLYGMAAECGLKRLMLCFRMVMNPAGTAPKESSDRKHANEIWSRFETYRSGHVDGAGYALSTLNSFHDWHVNQRYAHQSNFDQIRAQAHQQAVGWVPARGPTIFVAPNLIGEQPPQPTPGRRGPPSRIQTQLERIQALPRARQRFLADMIDMALQQPGQTSSSGS